MSPPSAVSQARPEPHSIGFNLAVIALAVALAGLGLAYLVDAAGDPAREQVRVESVARMLGGTALTIPARWMREDTQAAEGFAKQVDLAVSLPLGPEGALREIEITLTTRSRVRPSAVLLDGVYLHEFAPEQLSGPPGLVGKPLVARDGYAGETVWYDALSSSPFVAKCLAALTPEAPASCLRTVYLGPGLAAVYSFPDDVLGNWKAFDAQMYPLLRQIGAL